MINFKTIKVNLNELNSPETYIESCVSDKKLLTHRIINLKNLVEVFK